MATATVSDIKILYACGRFMLILRIIKILFNSFWQQIKSYNPNRSTVETSLRYIPPINKTSDTTHIHTHRDRHIHTHTDRQIHRQSQARLQILAFVSWLVCGF